jgi:PAS domain S-box-containing protein
MGSSDHARGYYHKSGAIIWVLLSVSLVKDENGAPRFFISQIQDV